MRQANANCIKMITTHIMTEGCNWFVARVLKCSQMGILLSSRNNEKQSEEEEFFHWEEVTFDILTNPQG